MYFEIYKNDKLIKHGDEILNEVSWDNELMYVPTCSITLPITYKEYIDGREEIKIFINDKCFWGIVKGIVLDKDAETIEVDLDHVVSEWEYRQISVNNAIKEKKLNFVYSEEDKNESSEPTLKEQLEKIYTDTNFAYPGWEIVFEDGAEDYVIDYVYSRQNKLEALTQTMELTEDLFWRVCFVNKKVITIGKFGEKKPYVMSKKDAGKSNISLIEDPKIEYDFDDVVNVASVYSEKSDSGMSSLTLREIYERPELQTEGFPVVILRQNVNNERDYKMYVTQYPKLAPNNELEYAVIDEESVALEGGKVIEGTFSFNDLGAFNTDSETITDADRIKVGQTVYEASKRKLRQLRRTYAINTVSTQFPVDLCVGDKIKFFYDNTLWELEECTSYFKTVLSYNDYFYITHVEYEFGPNDSEIVNVTLEKYLKIDRDGTN